MAIFLRVGAWYRATNKALTSDIEITGIIDDPNAEYPTADEIQDGGATPTINAVLLEDNDAGGLTIENLADPTTDQQVATKKYVDDNAGGATFAELLAADPNAAGEDIVDLNGLLFTQGGFIRLKSPDGTGWNITVDNAGALVITEDI